MQSSLGYIYDFHKELDANTSILEFLYQKYIYAITSGLSPGKSIAHYQIARSLFIGTASKTKLQIIALNPPTSIYLLPA